MNYKAISTLFCILLGACSLCYGMATEQIGPDTEHPTTSQPGWPKGIVEIPRHQSRAYSIWVNGNENFYFKATPDEINELLAFFAKARIRDHVVHIQSGKEKVSTFAKEEIEYNVRLQIVAGIALFMAREKQGVGLPMEPELTILTGDDTEIPKKLQWPKNVIVESDIQGVSINSQNKKPKRNIYYGKLEFEDGSLPVEFVKNRSLITLWEQKEADGMRIGSVNNKGYFSIRLSDKELANLKKGTSWLTFTIGNFLIEAKKTDHRFPIEMLTADKEQAKAVKVKNLEYYYGRVLFEDGAPPFLDSPPWWPGVEISIDFPYAGSASFDSEGYFKVYFSEDQYEQAKARKVRKNIYLPNYKKKGYSSAMFAYPVSMLSQDKAKAGIVKIPRPQPPRLELVDAESKLGKPIPNFDNIKFQNFQIDQAKGKPLLVCFWDMDQRPSRQCLQELEKQSQSLREKGIVVLAVHSGTKEQKEVNEWLTKENLSLKTGAIQGDPHENLLAWGVKGTPWLVLTDDQHIITKAGFNLDILEKVTER